ncbi:DUF1648 domain-containing protein [Jiangella ureilytica]|uniref:DUF1648 domain-containing protein n=1 Tax=Jiangella ureilytica TaxID=2530374 RepID=A0A4R4RXW0_9ACTN|nr:DUF1648 domain-containing protein [Jiangella ureilytica]TDC53772.1 DUF1648 domain-containing protein [Jiangella ureilytica]
MTEQTTRPSRGVVARAVLAAAGLPLVAGAVGVVLVRSWRDELPARVATHWGLDGTADGFSRASTVPWMVGGFAAAFALAGLALVLAVRADGTVTRVVAATTAGTTAFVTALVVGLTEPQRGLADAAGAPLRGGAVLAAAAIGVAVAVLAALLVPRWHARGGELPADAPRLAVGVEERVVWTRSVASGSLPVVVLVAGVGVTAVVAVVGRQWWVLALSAVMVLLAAAMFSITVTVDERGLTVRGRFGRPRMHTSLDRIERAGTVTVRPVRDFGGWGYRVSAMGPLRGTRGYVLRGGEALLVERTDGVRTVVTVDDAATAAGLLNGLLERRFGGV